MSKTVAEVIVETLQAAGHTMADLIGTLREAGYDGYSEISTYPARQPLDTLSAQPLRNVIVH